MNSIVVYKSISGFTEKYAKWLAEDLNANCVPLESFKATMVDAETILVFGGSLHAVGINGYERLKKIIKGAKYKELVIFAVGASLKTAGIEKELASMNFKTKDERDIRLFYLRGGFDFSKLDIWNKLLMSLLKIKIQFKKENDRVGDEKGMLAAFEKPLDATKRNNILEIVNYVKQRNGENHEG